MLNVLKKGKIGILLMILSSVFVCTGQLMWKISINEGVVYLLLGFLLYSMGALLMIIAYKHGKLSVLQPILSLNYALTIIFAVFILNEQIHWNKLAGILFIIIGVILIGGSEE